jgi:hypothetical protein
MWDTFVPTDIVGTASETKCTACTTFSTTSRNFLGNKVVEYAITDILIFVCEDLLPAFSSFDPSSCSGIIHQQWE